MKQNLNEQMQIELASMKKRHEMNQAVIGSWIDIGPAMGMIGTLVGLVAMLEIWLTLKLLDLQWQLLF